MTHANRWKHGLTLLLAAALPLGLLADSPYAHGVVYVVNTDDDSREDQCDATHCTLREAILAANGAREGAQIRFALPAFPHRI